MADIPAIGKTKIEAIRGDTILITATVERDGTVLNITGATFSMKIKHFVTQATMITLTPAIVAPATNGEVLITITVANWASITADGVYDVQMTEANGNITTIMRGDFIIINDIT